MKARPTVPGPAYVPTTGLTSEKLFWMPDDDMWHELVEGRLISMSPPGFAHAICWNRLNVALTAFVKERRLSLVAPQDTGFKLKSDPDTVRAPDVAFVAQARVPRGELPLKYWNGAPDLAVEVLSPGERTREVDTKVREYLDCGATAVWVVRPRTRTVTVHHRGGPAHLFAEGDLLEDPVVMPGFRYPLKDLFEDLPRR